MNATLLLPRLRPDQWQIAQHPAKVKVLSMGRRWGKTVLGGAVSLATASQGGRVAWIVPAYKNSRALWRFAKNAVAPLRQANLVKVNESEQLIDFVGSGGFLGIYSADNEDSVRGEAFHLVVVDEAAKISETAWTDAIQPTLADYDGDAILISTPRGKNWYFVEYQRGIQGGKQQVSFTAPSRANPNPRIQRAADIARDRVPERTYRQEWLAEFVEDGGGIFRRVRDAATATRQEKPQVDHGPGGVAIQHRYAMGVDWAKHADFTVLTVVDVNTKQLVWQDRFNMIDYAVQVGRLQALHERFRVSVIWAERNAMGEPLIEQLQRLRLPVRPFTTTNASKAEVIDALALAFERSEIQILDDPVLIAELQAYESTRLPSGLLRYGAPEGMHDDCVMSLALAWYGALNLSGVTPAAISKASTWTGETGGGSRWR